jgi:hypothetical protein
MTSYKVNFKRFVKKVLERDLVELSKMNENNEAILQHFVNKNSVQAFMSNHEKHFRMQFVIELVSSLIHCVKSAAK